MYLVFIDIPWWVVLIGFFTVWGFYTTRNFGYLESVGVKVISKPWPFIGSIPLAMFTGKMNSIETFFEPKTIKECRNATVGLYILGEPLIQTWDPEILKEVFIKQFKNFRDRNRIGPKDELTQSMVQNAQGEKWKNIRSTLSPALSSGKLKHMTAGIQKCITSVCDHIAKVDDAINVKHYMASFVTDAIGCTGFGIDVDSLADPNSLFIRHVKNIFNFEFSNPAVLLSLICPPLANLVMKLGWSNIYQPDSIEFFKTIIHNVQNSRDSHKIGPKRDFLQMMIDAEKKNREWMSQEVDEDIQSNTESVGIRATRTGLTHTETLANGLVFMAAGYDTTASTLTYVLYCLAFNLDVQEKVRQEAEEAPQDQDLSQYERYSKMTYLDMVIQETLRMYPIASILTREATDDCVVKGIPIRKGMSVQTFVTPLHRNPDVWPEPAKFIPERFTSEEKAKRDPIYYCPFGIGPRNCLGMRLALIEMKIAVANIVKRFQVSPAPDTMPPEEIKFGPSMVTLIQSN